MEIGAGFSSVAQKGSEHRDEMTPEGFCSNNAGGILVFLLPNNPSKLSKGCVVQNNRIYNNNGGKIVLPPLRITPNTPTKVDLVWKAGSGQGAGDGFISNVEFVSPNAVEENVPYKIHLTEVPLMAQPGYICITA